MKGVTNETNTSETDDRIPQDETDDQSPSTKKTYVRPSFWSSILFTAIGVPSIFWLRFGVINGISIALTVFLLLLLFASEYLPKFNDKYGAEQEAIKVKPSKFDILGVVWLLAIPAAPFLLWAISSMTTLDPQNWRLVLGAETFLCVALPVVCVLPLLRYVRGKATPWTLLILFIGTAFPVSIGATAAYDLIRGPQWQTVEISDITREHVIHRHKDIPTSTLKVYLTDGRVLEADSRKVTLEPGTCKILILRAVGEILAVE